MCLVLYHNLPTAKSVQGISSFSCTYCGVRFKDKTNSCRKTTWQKLANGVPKRGVLGILYRSGQKLTALRQDIPLQGHLPSALALRILEALCLCDHTLHTFHRRAAWPNNIQSSLGEDVRLTVGIPEAAGKGSRWGGAGAGGVEERTGWRLLFIPHVSGSGPHKFLCLVYFTQLSKWGLLI